MANVVDRDLGFRALRTRVAKTGFQKVTVGIHAEDGEEQYDPETPLTIAEIASFHEFGTRHIPERSFLRATVDESENDIRVMMRRLGRRIMSNSARMQPTEALTILGLHVQSLIRKRIRQGIPPPIAPATIARKGSSVPLIDTGQLIQSITFEVK